ncbi:hypothetical protein EV426DRAFT_702739 [Tirmania nivea]|nr:hypothetical protein EV426DRAFT_702739 [Tirmania nivea]
MPDSSIGLLPPRHNLRRMDCPDQGDILRCPCKPALTLALAALSVCGVGAKTTPINLKITTKSGARNKTAPLLHGLFFEDINHSGEGGKYAELIRNRAFQGSDGTSDWASIPWTPTLTAWKSIVGALPSLDLLSPPSDALKTVLKVETPDNSVGRWDGSMKGGGNGRGGHTDWCIRQQYEALFYLKASQPKYKRNISHITASLRSNLTSKAFASEKIKFTANLTTTKYTPNAASSSNNTTALTLDGKEAARQVFFFDLISVFPPTNKNRKNGLRKDLAQTLKDLIKILATGKTKKLGVLQLKWPAIPRVLGMVRGSRTGTALDHLCDYSLDVSGINPANTVPKDEMGVYIQEALDQLEYAMGDARTTLSRDRPGGVDWVNGEGRHYIEQPNLIGFTADPSQTVLFTPYYQSKLFATYTGTETLPIVNTNGDFNSLWWASSIEVPTSSKGAERIFVKLVNSGGDSVPVTTELDRTYAFNFRNNQTAIYLTEAKDAVDKWGSKKAWDVPSWSVVVLELR